MTVKQGSSDQAESSQMNDASRKTVRSPKSRAARFVLYLFMPVFALLALFLAFTQYHHYEPWRPEFVLAVLPIIGVGLCLGLMVAIWPRTAGFVVCVFLLNFYLMMQLPGYDLILVQVVFGSSLLSGIAAGIAAAGILVALWTQRDKLPPIAAGVFGTVFVSVLVLPPDRVLIGNQFERAGDSILGPPTLVHIVLDEHVGIEGIPADIAGSQQLRDDLLDFYRRYGFSLYGGAFSHSSQTQYSLAAMFNGQAFPDSDTATKPSPRATHALDRNRWFDRLADQGYDVRVYRNDWLDFCPDDPPNLKSCEVSPANSVLLLRDVELPALQKAKLILFGFWTSTATRLRYPLNPEYRLGAIAMKEGLSKMALDLKQNPRGTAVFAHFLMPHYSYVYDPSCNLKQEISTWQSRYIAYSTTGMVNTPDSRRERYQAYFDQVRCVYELLAGFFDELKQAGLYDDATIIVHGDHGSRIGIYDPWPQNRSLLTEDDLFDYYSTLYAVKRPGVEPSYSREQRSIQALFSEQFFGEVLDQSADRDLYLRGYDPSSDGPVMVVSMPDLRSRLEHLSRLAAEDLETGLQ